MASRALKLDHHHRIAKKSEPDKRVVDESKISARAYELWQAQGCPVGSDQEDWFNAEEELTQDPKTQ